MSEVRRPNLDACNILVDWLEERRPRAREPATRNLGVRDFFEIVWVAARARAGDDLDVCVILFRTNFRRGSVARAASRPKLP